jgi:hypothetical protein
MPLGCVSSSDGDDWHGPQLKTIFFCRSGPFRMTFSFCLSSLIITNTHNAQCGAARKVRLALRCVRKCAPHFAGDWPPPPGRRRRRIWDIMEAPGRRRPRRLDHDDDLKPGSGFRVTGKLPVKGSGNLPHGLGSGRDSYSALRTERVIWMLLHSTERFHAWMRTQTIHYHLGLRVRPDSGGAPGPDGSEVSES